MNLFNIISDIEKIDPEFQDRINPRRAAIKNMTGFGSKVALAALPLAMGSLFKKAYGQATKTPVEILNFALTLEYLEYEFYKKGIATTNLIPTGPGRTAIELIAAHELKHVNFLRTGISAAGGTPRAALTEANFNFPRVFPTVFTNYDTFLAVAQVFEDTGVRAYKGQAGGLLGNKDLLTAALNIHSVEARHASHIRQMRRGRANAAGTTTGVGAMKPWITGANDSGVGPSVDASYANEQNVSQGGVTITSLKGADGMNISVYAATECFDEPLTEPQVLAIVNPFFV